MNRAQAIVDVLVEAEPDAVDPQKYLDQLPSLNKARFVFTDHEVKYPKGCNNADEFIATPSEIEMGVIVYRDGRVSNRWDDGTTGIPDDIYQAASAEESYRTRKGEVADSWLDVYIDEEGNFVDWA